MTCARCGESEKNRAGHKFQRTIAGCTFVATVEVDACAGCRDVDVPVALMLAFDRAVAIDLATRGPASGETFRFIRKAASLQPIELARLLGVPLDTVTRWDSARGEIDLPSWLVVATIALEALDCPTPIVERIRLLRRSHAAEVDGPMNAPRVAVLNV